VILILLFILDSFYSHGCKQYCLLIHNSMQIFNSSKPDYESLKLETLVNCDDFPTSLLINYAFAHYICGNLS